MFVSNFSVAIESSQEITMELRARLNMLAAFVSLGFLAAIVLGMV
jgi:hypothetical protein